MSFISGSSHPIVLIAALAVVAIVVYGQVGWLLTSALHKKDPDTWDSDCRVVGTIFWPVVCLFLVLLGPGFRAFIRLVTIPQHLVEQKRESKAQRARDARRKQEEEQEKAAELKATRGVEAATSPVAEISKINDEMVKLASRKAELERRPDSSRH